MQSLPGVRALRSQGSRGGAWWTGLACLLAALASAGCAIDTTGTGAMPDDFDPVFLPDAGTLLPVDAAVLPPLADAGARPPQPGEPPLRDDGLSGRFGWRDQVRRALDRDTLPAAFAARGWALPAGSEVYAARVVEGVEGPAYVFYEAGGGAFSRDFWPASTIKVLAALGALDRLGAMGFTGDAVVAFDTGYTDRVGAILDRAILWSSNEDYDRSVRIAGFDRLNDVFLVPSRGLPDTVIQRSYAGFGVREVPGFTLTEGTHRERVPAHASTSPDRCPPRDGNCTNLFELTEGVRRILLRHEIPEEERFDVSETDLAHLEDSLCGATPSFFAEGATRAFRTPPRICHKPGWVPNNDCLDHGLVEDPRTGARFLLAAAVPERTGRSDCSALSAVAEQVLLALAGRADGMPLGPEAGVPIRVQLDDLGTVEGRRDYAITVEAPGADGVALYVDGWPIGQAAGPGPRFALRYAFVGEGERFLYARATRGGSAVGQRGLRVAIAPP